MIFIDTSIWIEFFRRSAARGPTRRTQDQIKRGLAQLLDEDRVALAVPVRIEVLSGVKKEQFSRLARLLNAVPTFTPSESTWELVERSALLGVTAGFHFGIGDLLIASIAEERQAPVWSLDTDFQTMELLGIVRNYSVP